jgi:hypothetical protein
MSSEQETWSNWAGNEVCKPSKVVHPETEDEVVAAIKEAAEAGLPVRFAGSGHSFSPICLTDGTLIVMDRLNGIIDADTESKRVRVWAGTRIRDFGDELWDKGLCLKNQGDIDAQQIAGAIMTATHGSGVKQQSFSASVRSFRMVTAAGEILDVDASKPELLAAAQVSLGLLGAVTQVELEVREAFGIGEHLEYWHINEVLDRWDAEMRDRRHFSFFWMPFDDSPDTLYMDYPEGMAMGDRAIVKLYDEVPASAVEDPTDAGEYRRRDRPYRIYPDPDFEGEIVNRELEYYVPFDQGKEAFLALRNLILTSYPECKFPVEIRSIAAEDALLSPFYDRDSIAISICGHEQHNYREFLADVARILDVFDARPHWGKIYYMDKSRFEQAFPRLEDFRKIRRQLDPQGLFLNEALRETFE